jgi:hypothetical protein
MSQRETITLGHRRKVREVAQESLKGVLCDREVTPVVSWRLGGLFITAAQPNVS